MAKAKAANDLPIVEELHFKSDSAFLCLLLNRRTKSIRVIDFRSGALPAKRLFIQSVAKREGVEKVYTLVEKDEVSSWTRVGFVREGNIPGFYKRSDGHLCGCLINEKTESLQMSEADTRQAERTVNHAKRNAKEVPDELTNVVVREITSAAAFRARDDVWKKGVGLNPFDDFGRDAKRRYVDAKCKRGILNYLSAEFQDCFGHSLIETLRSPEDDLDVLAITAGLRALCDWLTERELVSAFGFAPSDDIGLATAYTAAGFRKTGLLHGGIVVKGERKNAILWARKLINPADEN